MDILSEAIRTRRTKHQIHTQRTRLVKKILMTVIVLVIVFTFFFGVAVMKGDDMAPAIKDGDIVFYYRLFPSCSVSEVVVFKDKYGTQEIRRIEALQGTKIDVTKDGQLTENGNYQPIQKRRGLYYETHKMHGGIKYPVTVKPDTYFVLGDKRDSAKDSRKYGLVYKNQIQGKVFCVIRNAAI